MLKFIKHVALLFLYFVAYQIASGFLMVGPTLQTIPDIPAQLIDSTIWICAIIGLVLPLRSLFCYGSISIHVILLTIV